MVFGSLRKGVFFLLGLSIHEIDAKTNKARLFGFLLVDAWNMRAFWRMDGRLQHIHYKRLNGWMAGSRAVKGSKEAFLGL
ncbi:hypothetical protein HDV62DRAFT_364865 [Trichoderma sp. SZMC 28011]